MSAVNDRSTGVGPDDDSVGEIDETVDGDEIVYECATWAAESRGLLAGLLEADDIRHVWQGTTVTVFSRDQGRVDALIDDVLASARPALDPAAEKVAYEVGVWPAVLQTSLVDALTVADLPYEWDERGDLVVYAEHEDEVEAILDDLADPEDRETGESEDGTPGMSSDDGLVVHEVLDRLFMNADRLARHPTDAGAIVRVDEAGADLARMATPFGFEPRQWRTLVDRATQLRGALEAAPGTDGALDDDGLAALAVEVRDLVRRYV